MIFLVIIKLSKNDIFGFKIFPSYRNFFMKFIMISKSEKTFCHLKSSFIK